MARTWLPDSQMQRSGPGWDLPGPHPPSSQGKHEICLELSTAAASYRAFADEAEDLLLLLRRRDMPPCLQRLQKELLRAVLRPLLAQRLLLLPLYNKQRPLNVLLLRILLFFQTIKEHKSNRENEQ